MIQVSIQRTQCYNPRLITTNLELIMLIISHSCYPTLPLHKDLVNPVSSLLRTAADQLFLTLQYSSHFSSLFQPTGFLCRKEERRMEERVTRSILSPFKPQEAQLI